MLLVRATRIHMPLSGCLHNRLFYVEVELELAVVRGGRALLAALLDESGMAGVFGEGNRAVGQDAESEGSDGGEDEADGCRDADAAELVEADAVGTGPGVDSGEQAEVVEAGDAAVEQANDGEPEVAVVDGSGEDVEFAEEAACEGDSDEGEKEESKKGGEVGALAGEASVVVDGTDAFVVAADLGEDREGSNLHGGVGGGV